MHSGLEWAIVYEPKIVKIGHFWLFSGLFWGFLAILTLLTAVYPPYPPAIPESPGRTGPNGIFTFSREVCVFGVIFFLLLYKGVKSEILEIHQKCGSFWHFPGEKLSVFVFFAQNGFKLMTGSSFKPCLTIGACAGPCPVISKTIVKITHSSPL